MPANMDSLFGIHERSLLLRSQRATVLASNLANVDTPNYKARDLDFKSLLNNETKSVNLRKTRTNSRHLPIGTADGVTPQAPMKYRNPHQASLDGNTVENALEQGRFSENAVRYQASLQFISGQAKGILKALRGE